MGGATPKNPDLKGKYNVEVNLSSTSVNDPTNITVIWVEHLL